MSTFNVVVDVVVVDYDDNNDDSAIAVLVFLVLLLYVVVVVDVIVVKMLFLSFFLPVRGIPTNKYHVTLELIISAITTTFWVTCSRNL